MPQINFDFEKTKIFQAVKWEKLIFFRLAKILKILFLILFIFSFCLFIYGFFTDNFSKDSQSKFFGFSLISLVLFISNWLKIKFLDLKLKKPKLKVDINEVISVPERYNLAEFLSFEIARAVFKSIKFAKAKNLSQINSSILFYFLLKDNPKLNFIFFRALLDINEIKKILETHFKILKPAENKEFYSSDFQILILEALKIAQKKGHQRIEIGDIILSLAKNDLIFRKILIDANLKINDIENLIWWLEDLDKYFEERKKFWEWKNLLKKGSLAKQWTAGYTLTLDKFSIDWSEVVKKQDFPEIIGHQKEIEAMERILARRESKNDVLIVGEAGSGRKSMVQAIAIKSVLGESWPEINYKRIVELDMPAILSQAESIEESELLLDNIFQEVLKAGNVILVIDEFHNYVGHHLKAAQPGKIDMSGVILPYLSLVDFQVIAITTFEGFHKYIEEVTPVISLFEKVEVSEISEKETLKLLGNLSLRLEARYKKFISYQAIRDIILLTEKYIPAIPFPEKAMNLLEEAMVFLTQTKDKILLPKHIAKIVTEKVKVPVGEIETKEREILLNLEKLIHQRIINQEEAVKEVATALRRARAEVQVRRGPMGCFLFLGPTGVGKTETARALTEVYFGSENKMIRLDMSEFQDIGDISRLIGSSGQEGLLTTPVREAPFSLILLDEIEKSHPNILNLFLQVLDEGHLTDGLGRKVDFKNSIIIATSNAGYQIILEALKQGTDWSQVKGKLLDYLFEKAIFRPEFVNRFDAVVVFKPLTKENLLNIAELLLQKLKKNLAEKEIEFIITQPLKEKIVELSYDITFGARNMQRVIQDKIGDSLASAILSGELKKGNRVEIDPSEFKLKINP